MTRKADGPGQRLPGPSEDTSPAGRGSVVIVADETVSAQLRRRREASWRLPPLAGGHRDPLDALASPAVGPSAYGLTHAELGRHVRQLRRDGWQGWEVCARFGFGMVTDAA